MTNMTSIIVNHKYGLLTEIYYILCNFRCRNRAYCSMHDHLVGIYLLTVNNEITKILYEICSKLTINRSKQRY